MKSHIFEKGNLFSEEKIWLLPSRNVDQDNFQGTTYEGPQGNLTTTVDVIGPFPKDLRPYWRHKRLKKKQYIQWRKIYGLFFSRITEHAKSRQKNYRGQQANLHFNVEGKRSFH